MNSFLVQVVVYKWRNFWISQGNLYAGFSWLNQRPCLHSSNLSALFSVVFKLGVSSQRGFKNWRVVLGFKCLALISNAFFMFFSKFIICFTAFSTIANWQSYSWRYILAISILSTIENMSKKTKENLTKESIK